MRRFFAFLLFLDVNTKLEYSTIRKALKWTSENGEQVRHDGRLLNPLRGFVFNKAGIVHNVRFFSQYNGPKYEIKVTKEESEKDKEILYRRHYNIDTAVGVTPSTRHFLHSFHQVQGVRLFARQETDLSTMNWLSSETEKTLQAEMLQSSL